MFYLIVLGILFCVLRAQCPPSAKYTYDVHLTTRQIDWDSKQSFCLAVPAPRKICHKGSRSIRDLCLLNLRCVHLYNKGLYFLRLFFGVNFVDLVKPASFALSCCVCLLHLTGYHY